MNKAPGQNNLHPHPKKIKPCHLKPWFLIIRDPLKAYWYKWIIVDCFQTQLI